MSTTSAVQMVVEGASAKITEGTKIALSAITHSGIVDHYLSPLVRYFHLKYQESAMHVRLGMLGCGVLMALPVICFLGALLMADLGCTSFVAFAILVLCPMLLVTLMIVGGPLVLLLVVYQVMTTLYRATQDVAQRPLTKK
ncbi:hypothetical protein EDD11_009663 [Mortierella claussenii]|nr:hypothetical protein EDD11_009663 [Mortierella claussenii]